MTTVTKIDVAVRLIIYKICEICENCIIKRISLPGSEDVKIHFRFPNGVFPLLQFWPLCWLSLRKLPKISDVKTTRRILARPTSTAQHS